MLQKPVVHLFIPQLIQPLINWNQEFLFEPICNCFEDYSYRLGVSSGKKVQGLDASLFDYLGFDEEELPIAQYRYQAQGELMDCAMLCADPVHYQIGMNDITLTEIIADLSYADLKELKNLINEYYKDDELEFIIDLNNQCYISFPNNESVITTPIDEVLNKNIAGFLPFSKDRNWKVIQNEMQMLLHGSEFNQQREANGLLAVNSLWFWGGGQKQDFVNNLNAVFSHPDSKGKMFSEAANCQWHKLPKDGNQILEHNLNESVVILDQLLPAIIANDANEYQRQLTKLDEDYLKPLNLAWKAGKIELLIHACDGQVIKPQLVASWKFWIKRKSMLDLAHEISST